MKIFSSLLLIGLFVLSSCSSKTEMEENLIGTWSSTELGIVMQFSEDGKVNIKGAQNDFYEPMGMYKLNEEEFTLEISDPTRGRENKTFTIRYLKATSMEIAFDDETIIAFVKD